MSSNPVWEKDASGVEHPTHELILAFIRGQCSEHEGSRISGHFHAGCVPCNRLHIRLTQESATLNQLKHMSRYLYYPQLQPGRVLLHAQRGEPLTSVWTGKRKRKFQAQSRTGGRPQPARQYAQKATLRVFSLPAAFAMLLLFMLVAFMLAYAFVTMGKGSLNGQPTNNIYIGRGPYTPGVVPHQPTPTNTASVTLTATPSVSATDGASATSTATGPVGPKPTIEICSSPTYMHLAICGYGFKVGDQVSLVLEYYGNKPSVSRRSLIVDKRGEFMDSWNIYSCRYLPIAIYAVDVTQKSVSITSNTLTPIAMASCDWPTPTVTPGGH